MNKLELINTISNQTKLTRLDVSKVLDTLFATITSSLQVDDKVSIHGFGSFSKRTRKSRQVRNPRTGNLIQIESANLPKFIPGIGLKKALNTKK